MNNSGRKLNFVFLGPVLDCDEIAAADLIASMVENGLLLIFITTSSYQNSALEYAKAVFDSLILVDGNKIAELMIEAEVGVSVKRKIVIPEIDNDYFER